jgi:TatD DNase family protein
VPELIDTHCHLDFERYNEDRDEVMQRAAAAGVTRIIIPSIDVGSSRSVVRLSQSLTGVYAAVGIHPNSTADFDDAMIDQLRDLAREEKVVSIGEIGLDYYWDKSPKDIQAKAFEAQLQLAAALELPVIIHNRDASEDVMNILERWVYTLPESLKTCPGVLHSFSAPLDIAERALAAGFYLGFTGPITFKKADDLRRAAALTPLDRILVETDGPFLTPEPYRGKRNEPAYIPYIVERLATVKQVSVETLAQATTANAARLFSKLNS